MNLAVRGPESRTRRLIYSFPGAIFALYALLLGVVSLRHEMFRDEVQAWLIARDSTSIPNLFFNMRYEGHPALWQLLLYIPSHLSWNPEWMQLINYLLAVCEAWLILSESRMSRATRVLLVFSFFVFYGYGVVARDYMLAMLMLTAAARCLLGEKRRPSLAILFLALAINSHFFAIPIAVLIFVILYCFAEPDSFKAPALLFRKMSFWIPSAALLASLIAAYFTLRPRSDSYTPHYGLNHLSNFDYFLMSLGRSWQMFVPIPEAFMPQRLREALVPRSAPSLLSVTLALAILLVIAFGLRTARARWFFLLSALFEYAVFAVTVRIPPVRHYGLIICALIIALMMDAIGAKGQHERRISGLRSSALFALLALQVFGSVTASAVDLVRPFSEAKETALWMRSTGLNRNPIVITPDLVTSSVVGYMERDKVYYPECQCFGSFVLWNRTRNPDRMLTVGELEVLARTSPLPPIVIENSLLDEASTTRLRLHLLRAFDRHPMYANECFYVYEYADLVLARTTHP